MASLEKSLEVKVMTTCRLTTMMIHFNIRRVKIQKR